MTANPRLARQGDGLQAWRDDARSVSPTAMAPAPISSGGVAGGSGPGGGGSSSLIVPRGAPELATTAPGARVALSTASTYPESTASAFEMAARLGYDGVEIMVWTDPVSQDPQALKRLMDYHGIPILAIHAPCLLLTQRVWGTDPWAKLVRARTVAETLGASTVVVHPPFRWQRDYAREFVTGIERMAGETDIRFAVENMFPLRARGREVSAYAPDWSPVEDDYAHVTLDLSHTSVSRSDPLEMAELLGERLVHVHMADGLGSAKDEHLVPGRGTQPCAELLELLAAGGFDGTVVVEINTRRAESRAQREAELAEALAFTRLHFAAPSAAGLRSTYG
ncbi:sugar phosphate isomerase/epimerase [Frankia casuarinae]|nr:MULTISPECIES: sugar phosphate isomerase/epimerase [Frankia]ETA04431.1 sugar phosphate isomerase/epimerase [Frankia sp. CcI6]EYT92317.1 sugar phosphate isomerase/epimerase [Frankia casuarinae]KDA42421.1 sugar phosphate isomerase/epimerase [Frankia sp. BMG5.23]